MQTRRWLWAGLVSLSAGLAGCSSDSGGPTELPASVSVNSASASAEAETAVAFSPGTALGSGLQVQWDFGDGTTSTQASPSHAYAQAGEYDVVLTVTNEAGEVRRSNPFRLTVSRMAIVNGAVCSGPSQSGWCWQQPRPVGNMIYDAYFVNEAVGWAVGDAGRVMKTTDGGATWVAQATPTTHTLQEVRFADANNGWILGTFGTILHTSNGGSTWEQQAPGFLYPDSLYGDARLWVTGSGTALINNPEGWYATSDGGQTWSAAAGSFLHGQVLVTGQGTVWSLGNGLALAKSTDRGGSFNTVLQSPQANISIDRFDVDADEQHVWAIGLDRSDVSVPAGKVTLWRSADGGASWTASTPAGITPDGYASPLHALKFFGLRTGWAASFYALHRTTDGGDSWSAVPLPPDLAGSPALGGVQFLSADVVAVPFQDGAYVSRDGGATWQLVSAEDSHGNVPQVQLLGGNIWLQYGDRWYRPTGSGTGWQRVFGGEPQASATLRSVWFIDARHGMAIGDAGWLMETFDAGATWTRRQPGGGSHAIGRLQFASATQGWMLLDPSGVRMTSDGGATWSAPSGQGNPFNNDVVDFHFVDGAQGWALGGRLYKSLDGGQHWSVQADLPGGGRSIRFVTPSLGFIVGANGMILRSTDGGATWQRQASGVTADLRQVFFADANHGWAVGTSGAMTRTTDGGNTWTPATLTSGQNLNGVVFADAQRGWIAGDNGLILATTDGGATWAVQKTGSSRNINALFLLDSRTLWAAGDGSSVMVTATAGR